MKKLAFQFNIRAQADDTYEISIRGIIGQRFDYSDYSVKDTEQDVLNEIKQIPEGKKINVRINSRGGDVGLGLGIYNALSRRKKDITTYNDGYALSAGSIVLLAGSKRVCPTGSITMIHRAQGGVDGTGKDMRSMADGMDVIDGMLAAVYAEVSGKKSKEEFLDMMDKTSWFDGEKCLDLGLSTHCEGEVPEGDDDEEVTDAEKKIIASFEKTIPTNLRARVLPKAAAVRAEHTAGAPANKTNSAGTPPPAAKEKTMKKITAALVAAGYNVAIDAEEDAVLPHISALINSNKDLKTKCEGHETALKNRVTKKVEAAVTDKLVKAERKDALIKAGMADESTLDFIDDLRADASAKQPRGAAPARRNEGDPENVDEELEANDAIIHNSRTDVAKRSTAIRANLKARGLDGIVKKPSETRN